MVGNKAKKVTITYTEGVKSPQVDFEGLWTGYDIRVLSLNVLPRAYKLYIKEQRSKANE